MLGLLLDRLRSYTQENMHHFFVSRFAGRQSAECGEPTDILAFCGRGLARQPNVYPTDRGACVCLVVVVIVSLKSGFASTLCINVSFVSWSYFPKCDRNPTRSNPSCTHTLILLYTHFDLSRLCCTLRVALPCPCFSDLLTLPLLASISALSFFSQRSLAYMITQGKTVIYARAASSAHDATKQSHEQ